MGPWTPYEFKLKIGENELGWKGWEAALLSELIIAGAAMTRKGALEFIRSSGRFSITQKKIDAFLRGQVQDGLLSMHSEKGIKTGRRRRIYSSTLKTGEFLFQLTKKEET